MNLALRADGRRIYIRAQVLLGRIDTLERENEKIFLEPRAHRGLISCQRDVNAEYKSGDQPVANWMPAAETKQPLRPLRSGDVERPRRKGVGADLRLNFRVNL